MIPAPFDYHAPKSLAEAIELLQQHGDQAKVLSGGQSLLPLLKLRMGAAAHLVDIGRIPGLEYIKEEDGFLTIGGCTRESAIERSDLIKKKYPILHDTAVVIADPIVRNRATIGGNLAHADPANDHPATMIALGAEVTVAGHKGQRTIPIDKFFTGIFSTALAADEILTEIRIPKPPARSGGAYVKLERKVGDFATAAAAVQVTLGADGTRRARRNRADRRRADAHQGCRSRAIPSEEETGRQNDRRGGEAGRTGGRRRRRIAGDRWNTSARWRAC